MKWRSASQSRLSPSLLDLPLLTVRVAGPALAAMPYGKVLRAAQSAVPPPDGLLPDS